MIYLLDTECVISYLGNRRDAVALIERLSRENTALSVVTIGEVYEGFERLSVPDQRQSVFEEMFPTMLLLAVNMRAARDYAKLRAQLRSTGNLIPDNDLWIAATAVAHDLVLVSRDAHFVRVPGLRVH